MLYLMFEYFVNVEDWFDIFVFCLVVLEVVVLIGVFEKFVVCVCVICCDYYVIVDEYL